MNKNNSLRCEQYEVLKLLFRCLYKDIEKEVLELHIAHNEGNYFCSNDELKSIEDNDQIAVTYCDHKGNDDEVNNPNGALKNIAGIFNKDKNILGMMPHPCLLYTSPSPRDP